MHHAVVDQQPINNGFHHLPHARMAPQVDVMELDHQDAKPRKQVGGRIQQQLVLSTFDVDLAYPLPVVTHARCLHPILQTQTIGAAIGSDELLHEVHP